MKQVSLKPAKLKTNIKYLFAEEFVPSNSVYAVNAPLSVCMSLYQLCTSGHCKAALSGIMSEEPFSCPATNSGWD